MNIQFNLKLIKQMFKIKLNIITINKLLNINIINLIKNIY